MLQIVDFRFDWEKRKIIICMLHCDTGKHFYIHQAIESEQEADEIISFWEMQTSMFFVQHYSIRIEVMMAKRIGRIEYHFLIRRDAADKQYEQHIVNIRYVGETTSMSYKFAEFVDAMRFLNKVIATDELNHS